MASGHQITITPTDRHVEVFLGGEKVASSDRAVVLAETGLPDRYYLPADDVRTDLLRPTSTKSTCPYKGEAVYWSVEAGGRVHEDLVWSYPDPIPGAAGITGLLCFWPERGAEVVVAAAQPVR
jgi:uncharacterized protein (DUF427 family)